MRLEKITLISHSVLLLTTQFEGAHVSLKSTFLSCPQPSVFFPQLVPLRVICPDGLTADSPAACNKGCLAMPRSQRLTGKPCGPAPRQSGVGRNPLPPGRTG